MSIGWLNLFAHKAALGLYFHHFRKPLTDAGRVYASWTTKEDLASKGIPSVILAMLPDYGTIVQGSWNERETFEYRYAWNEEEGLFACFARFRHGLFVFGLAIADSSRLPEGGDDWLRPSELLQMRTDQRFGKRR
jgi:hypothetical protein